MLYRKMIAAIISAAAMLIIVQAAPGVSARSAVLLDAGSGRVLLEKNGDEMLPIASTTKILTALVTLENCSLDEVVRIPPEAVGVEGSSLYLTAGERLTVEQLLYGMLLRSGNDAAVALAIHCAGSVEGFADMMNQRTAELGLKNCHFTNPNGLYEENHLCSASDLAAIAAEAMANPDFAAIVATKSYTFGNRTVVNHNKLLSIYDGAVGIKTGFTKKSGRTLVGAAERDDQLLIAVTLSAPDDWSDHAALFDYGFSQCKSRELIAPGQILDSAAILGGTGNCIPVQAESGFSYPVLDGEKVELRSNLPAFLYAPVTKGQIVGETEILLNGKVIGRVFLETSAGVEAKPSEKKPGIWKRILGLFYE